VICLFYSAMKLEDLGYNSFFEAEKNQLGFGDFLVARVTSEHRGAYKVKDADGEYLAKITGKQMFEASSREDYPAIGDWVVITKPDHEHAVICSVLPRTTVIKRKSGDRNRINEKKETQIIATNIDVAFIVESIDRDYSLNRFERYFVIAQDGGARPVVILNKIDLISQELLDEKINQLKNRFSNIDVILTSVVSNDGLLNLKNYIVAGKTYCFLGSSGVGKSSLINKLIGESVIKTGDISLYSGRGKHVTTGRQMYFLNSGGIVIDNPGMREVGMTDTDKGIDTFFDEISVLGRECKYTDCTHTHEPGCEVINAVDTGRLDREQYSNYINLKKEAEYYELDKIEKREKDRQFGKFLKKAKKELKSFGHKD